MNSKIYHTILPDKKYGKWTVLEEGARDKRGAQQFKCRCECGTEKLVLAQNLVSGRSKHCVECNKKTIYDVLLDLVVCEPTTLETGCWIWTKKKTRGYGNISRNKTTLQVHRVVYEHFCGPIPEGKQLDHLCKNPACSNFEHLEPVTPRENTLRGNTLAATNAAKTHCIHGHPFNEENTKFNKDGSRYCKTCHEIKGIAYREKNKEKILEQRREYYEKNKEKLVAYRQEYRAKNKVKISAKSKEYYNRNRSSILAKNKEYYKGKINERTVESNTL